MVRIEIHLDKTETDILDSIAKEDGRPSDESISDIIDAFGG